MRVLVTGSSGLVGGALMRELERTAGYEAVAAPRASLDLRSFDETRRFLDQVRPEIVFHLAAKVGGLGGNIAEPASFFYENVVINTNVIEASRLAGVRKVVAMGSTACYSDRIGLPMLEADIWDGPPHGSEAPYAHAKRAMLAQLEAYNIQYGLDYAFCIATNLFGPGDRFDEAHGHVAPTLISKFHRATRDGGPIVVWGTGSPKRDFLFSEDAARFLRVVGERFTGAINLASGEVTTIRELVEALRHISGFAGRLEWDLRKPNGQELRSYDVSKLASLGLKPAGDFRTSLAATYAWFDQNAGTARR